MLPEHVKMLREWAREDEWEAKKQPDEQSLEILDEIAQKARLSGKTVTVRYYENHHYERITGRIDSFDILSKQLRMTDECGRLRSIPLEAIDDIEPESR